MPPLYDGEGSTYNDSPIFDDTGLTWGSTPANGNEFAIDEPIQKTYKQYTDEDGSVTGVPGTVYQRGSDGAITVIWRPSTSSSGGGAAPKEPGGWTGTPPDGRPYGTYSLDGPGGTPGTFLGDPSKPEAPAKKDVQDSYVGADGKLHILVVNPDGSVTDEIVEGAAPQTPKANTTTVKNADGTTSVVNTDTGAVISVIGSPEVETITNDGIIYRVNADGTLTAVGGSSNNEAAAARQASSDASANARAAASEAAANARLATQLEAQGKLAKEERDNENFWRGREEWYKNEALKFEKIAKQGELAEQYARLISNSDPTALRAFDEAGGGDLWNAYRGGNTATSDLANLGAARTLQTIDDLNAAPVGPPGPAMPGAGGGAPAPVAGGGGRGWDRGGRRGPGPEAVSTAPATLPAAIAPVAAAVGDAINGWRRPPPVPMMARGGTTGARQFISGDPQFPGRPNPEMVRIVNPGPNTRTEVTPITMGAMAQNQRRGGVPMFATGTRNTFTSRYNALRPVASPTPITTQPVSPSVGSSPPPPSTTNPPPVAPVSQAPGALPAPTVPPPPAPTGMAAPGAAPPPVAAAQPGAIPTATNAGAAYSPVTAADQPYLDRVAALRATARPAAEDAFRRMQLVNYERTSPTLRAGDTASIATAFGAPAEDTEFWRQRNRFAGSGFYGSPVVAY